MHHTLAVLLSLGLLTSAAKSQLPSDRLALRLVSDWLSCLGWALKSAMMISSIRLPVSIREVARVVLARQSGKMATSTASTSHP